MDAPLGSEYVKQYRVTMQVSDLGWVDLVLRAPFGWWAATISFLLPK